jgi:Kef-type K+ transport system membrane component KefB/mannitol/fructose-specific phosphotransferase system IIA component (Ntr-type)/nucleotide-binding universal stress UspA family protein
MNYIRSMMEDLPVTDPVLIFALVMLIILVAPLLMSRFRLPGIIGVLIAGAIIGPNALGILQRDETIELLGTVGLLYLMFVAGMSLDLHQFQQMRKRSISFGTISFLIPQTLGIAAGMMFLQYDVVTALLLGSIVGSHTLLAYPVAKRIGITRNGAVTAAIGGTIVTDGLALTVLAVVVATVQPEGLSTMFWVEFTVLVGAFVAAVVFGLPLLGRWFFRNISGERGDIDFVFLMVVLFFAATLSSLVGLAPIVGAFLAGLTMNRLVPDTGPLMNRLNFVGDALFIPFFLLWIGMLVDFRALATSLDVWIMAAIFTGLVIIGKALAVAIAKQAFGYTSNESWAVFGLTIPQAAATLAVTLVGFQLEMFSQTEVNAVVVMILLTAIAGPWLVEHFGRRVALQEEIAPFKTGESPLRILIPLANPSSAPALMDLAFMIRRPDSPEPVYPLMVANEASDVQIQVAAGERMLGYAVIYASGAGVPVQPVTRVDTNIANGISRAITELRISTIVIGWSGSPSRRRFSIGTVLDQVLRDNQQTVIVCRLTTPLNTMGRVVLVVPPFVEREPGFGEAIRTIKLLSSRLGAKLVVMASEVEVKHLEPRMKRIKPQISTSYQPITPWSSLGSHLGEHVKDDDLVILLSTREGRLPWSPELSRMPRRLADQFPSHNLVLYYPSEHVHDTHSSWPTQAEQQQQIETTSIGLLEPARTSLGIAAMPFEDAIEYVIAPHFKDQPYAITDALRALEKNAREYSTEVTPGAALLHAHIPQVNKPTFFLATCEDGLELPRVTKLVHVLLILLTPSDLSPEEHLGTLARIASMMRAPDLVAQLRTVQSFEELRDTLKPVSPKS